MRIFPGVTVQPTDEPLTLAEVKSHLNIDTSDHDTILAIHQKSARQEFEKLTGLRLMPQTLAVTVEAWPAEFWPQFAPLTSVGIAYTDVDGVTETLSASDYVVRPYNGDALLKVIRPAADASWPNLGDDPQITLTFGAGYANAAAVPWTCKLGILVRTAELFQGRTDPEPSQAFTRFIDSNRVVWCL